MIFYSCLDLNTSNSETSATTSRSMGFVLQEQQSKVRKHKIYNRKETCRRRGREVTEQDLKNLKNVITPTYISHESGMPLMAHFYGRLVVL